MSVLYDPTVNAPRQRSANAVHVVSEAEYNTIMTMLFNNWGVDNDSDKRASEEGLINHFVFYGTSPEFDYENNHFVAGNDQSYSLTPLKTALNLRGVSCRRFARFRADKVYLWYTGVPKTVEEDPTQDSGRYRNLIEELLAKKAQSNINAALACVDFLDGGKKIPPTVMHTNRSARAYNVLHSSRSGFMLAAKAATPAIEHGTSIANQTISREAAQVAGASMKSDYGFTT